MTGFRDGLPGPAVWSNIRRMKVIYSPKQELHAPESFISSGRVLPSPECPERADRLFAAVRSAGHEITAPDPAPDSAIAAIHSIDYLRFLATAHERWQALPNPSPSVIPNMHPGRHMDHYPAHVIGQAGWHMADTACPIGAATWEAARAAADCAVTAAADVLSNGSPAYALCRPPGHHAYHDQAGGFCFLNNVAIAADWVRAQGHRAAILDIDVHHGNGTQGIFYHRKDIYFVSIHADPSNFYPFFAGYAGERGAGEGLGFNLNLPQAPGTGDEGWLQAIDHALTELQRNGTEVLLLSLGLDPQENDPLGVLKITTEGFRRAGAAISAFPGPVAIIQEGGYLCEELGANLAAFLDGFENG